MVKLWVGWCVLVTARGGLGLARADTAKPGCLACNYVALELIEALDVGGVDRVGHLLHRHVGEALDHRTDPAQRGCQKHIVC